MPDDDEEIAEGATDRLKPDAAAIKEHVEMLSDFLGQHAGGLTLEGVDEAGHVTVRYTGMCTGCLYRPVTMGATIRPFLLDVEGVTSVDAVGSRMNDKANARLEEDLGRWWVGLDAAQAAKTPEEPD